MPLLHEQKRGAKRDHSPQAIGVSGVLLENNLVGVRHALRLVHFRIQDRVGLLATCVNAVPVAILEPNDDGLVAGGYAKTVGVQFPVG